MAIINDVAASSNTRVAAEGFLNVSIVAKDGTVFRLRAGIPLYSSNRIENSILKAVLDNPETVLNITGAVVLVNDPKRDTSQIAL